MKSDLSNIMRFLSKGHDIDISTFDPVFIRNSIKRRFAVTGTQSVKEYERYLKANPDEAEKFYKSLNITYSEFFRNSFTFACLEKVFLPLIINNKQRKREKEIRVWSAGCAAGQEAYSIAMLLDEITETNRRITFRIFATDINREELARGRTGAFQASNLNNLSLHRLRKYFISQGEDYLILPRVRDCICFSYFDLLNRNGLSPPESIFGSFDLVFCNNILYYYHPKQRKEILDKITKNIAPGGFLVTSETERGFVSRDLFNEPILYSAVFQLKMNNSHEDTKRP